MKEVERDGVLIDVCPNCKGVWLDRGELDKLSNRVKEVREPFNNWYDREDERYRERQNHQYERYDKHGKSYQPHRKKKKSVIDMLGDIFD